MAEVFHPDSVFWWNDLVLVNSQQKMDKTFFLFFLTGILHVKNGLLFDGRMNYRIPRFLLYFNYIL
jgi:hypothetical protein